MLSDNQALSMRSPEELYEDKEELEGLVRHIWTLPETVRSTVEYVNGFGCGGGETRPCTAVGKMLGVSGTTIGTRHNAAVYQILRKRWAEADFCTVKNKGTFRPLPWKSSWFSVHFALENAPAVLHSKISDMFMKYQRLQYDIWANYPCAARFETAPNATLWLQDLILEQLVSEWFNAGLPSACLTFRQLTQRLGVDASNQLCWLDLADTAKMPHKTAPIVQNNKKHEAPMSRLNMDAVRAHQKTVVVLDAHTADLSKAIYEKHIAWVRANDKVDAQIIALTQALAWETVTQLDQLSLMDNVRASIEELLAVMRKLEWPKSA